jgi:ribosomal-protein-alanine N-acetyltransferase
MRHEDVEKVTAIDREAFPTQWPPTNYKHEMRNRMAHYMVVCDEEQPLPLTVEEPGNGKGGGLLSRLKQLFGVRGNSGNGQHPQESHEIIGFVGFWVMADEAHITAIAVSEEYQRRGIGEVLMTAVIAMARKFGARIVTLEVRVSNTGAQSLYSRYGFAKVGVRKHYYTDNREDAFIMSTENIDTASYKALCGELKTNLAEKLGAPVPKVRRKSR